MPSMPITPTGTTNFTGKVATSPPNQLPPEVLQAIKTLTDFIAQHPIDQFTAVAKSAETAAAKAAEQEIVAAKRHWFATPRLFRTMGTPLKNMMESAGRATLRDVAVVGSIAAPFIRSTPLLAAVPLAVGAYRFIRTTLENGKWSFWIKELGANKSLGHYLTHESTLRAADRSTMLNTIRRQDKK